MPPFRDELAYREELYVRIQQCLHGEDPLMAVASLADSYAAAVAYCSNNPDHAEALIRKMVPDMVATIKMNWDYIQSARDQQTALEAMEMGQPQGNA
jgi:acyl-coenzyme A thioesterase PaaI-like protein